MEGFELPAAADQPVCQEIQEGQLCGPLGLETEVAGGLDERLSEMVHPNPICQDTCGEWVRWGWDGEC